MSSKGKILILKLNGKLLALLIRDNQILSIQVQKQNEYAVGNIYVGKVKNIAENIGAAFVDLGQGYLTFLPLTEAKYACVMNRKPDGSLKTGDEFPVQIVKEPMKTKQAGVTTQLCLSGQYAVVGIRQTANSDGKGPAQAALTATAESGGTTRQAAADGDRGRSNVQVSSKLSRKQQLRFRSMEALQQIAARCRLIVRTNAAELGDDTLLVEDAGDLAAQLDHIMQIADKRVCFSCLYAGRPDYIHFIENTYRTEYDEIITDIPEIYQVLQEHLTGTELSVRLYEDKMLPLYKLYAVEMRIRDLLDRKVWLKSGGYLIIEPTEALISIDVNSGVKTKKRRFTESTGKRLK